MKQQLMPLLRNPQELPISHLTQSTLLLAFRVLSNLAGPDSPSSTASLELHRASFTPTILSTGPSLHFSLSVPLCLQMAFLLGFPSLRTLPMLPRPPPPRGPPRFLLPTKLLQDLVGALSVDSCLFIQQTGTGVAEAPGMNPTEPALKKLEIVCY